MIEWGQKSKPKKIPGPKIYLPPPHPLTKKKSKKKNSHAEFPSLKNFQKALNDIRWKKKFWKTSFVVTLCFVAEVCGQDMQSLHESSDCFEYPQNSLIKPSYPKKFLPKFPTLEKSCKWKFQTPQNPLIILVTWNPKYLLGSCLSTVQILCIVCL